MFWISHFLDDYPLLHVDRPSVEYFRDEFYRIMADIGMPVATHKTLGPTQVLEYLGLILNFLLQTIQIPEKKRQKCLALIERLLASKKVTIKMIQQTVGSLNFICQALPARRVFLQSLYRLTRNSDGSRARAGHHRRLNRETIEDLKMFQEFLQEQADPSINSIPFLNKVKVNNSDIQLYADSAGAIDKGLGIYFNGEWRAAKWEETKLFSDGFRPNIALLELLAIVLAVDMWASKVSGKWIVL